MDWSNIFDFSGGVSPELNPGNVPLPGLGGGSTDSFNFMDFAPDLSDTSSFLNPSSNAYVDPSWWNQPAATPVSPALNPNNQALPGLGGGKAPEVAPTGEKSMGSKLWDKVTDMNPLTLAMLGMAGINAARGPQTPAAVGPLTKGTKETEAYVKQRGEPVDKLTQQLTQQYQTGKIDPADEMRINQWYQGEKGKIDQYYAKTGMPDSTAHMYALQELETKKKGLYDEVRQGYLNAAMKGMGMQGQTTSQVANLQNYLNQTIATLQQSGDQQSAQALQNLMYSAGLAERMGG